MGKPRHRDVNCLPKLTQLPTGKARMEPRRRDPGQHTYFLQTLPRTSAACLPASVPPVENIATRAFVLDPGECPAAQPGSHMPRWTWPPQASDTPERVRSGPGVRLETTWQELHPRNPGAHWDPPDKSVRSLLGRTPAPAERTLHRLQLQVASEDNGQAVVRSREGQCPAGGHGAGSGHLAQGCLVALSAPP